MATMSVRREIQEYDGVYFITITCSGWLHLFEIADAYDAVYIWFDTLKSRDHFIAGYVIMPNHLHALIAFRNTQGESINRIIGTGKRFMAYELVKRLKSRDENEILALLSSRVNATDARRGKKHEVFEPSFDWKECSTMRLMEQKLEYLHANPCRGKWYLVNDQADYIHSSAGYYATGIFGIYPVTNYAMLQDVDLTKPK